MSRSTRVDEEDELRDVVHHDDAASEHDDDDPSRFGPAPVPQDFNTEKPKRILSRTVITCLISCCCILPIALILFVAVLISTLFFYSPYTANYSLREQHSPKVVHGKLSNGFRYAILNNGVKSGKYSTYLQVNTGSTNELEKERGISHMVEHMAFDNSKDFPGRGGTWRQISQGGIGYFNAYTSFRNTVYMFLDVIVDRPDSTSSLKRIMNIFYNQVQNAQVIDEYLQIEKGAVLGEARMRNSSMAIALDKMLANHGGDMWKIGTRMPIGTQPIIKSWTAADANAYYNKWYRLDKMILYFVGDIDASLVEKTVKEFWEPKALKSGQNTETVDNVEIGRPKPSEKFVLSEVDGINGINFNLLITQPYIGHPRDVNYYRREFADMLFTLTYAMQVISRLLSEYPGMTLDDFALRNAGVQSMNEYAFDSCLTAMVILTPGPRPNSGTWRKDLAIAVEELNALARDGPSEMTIMGLSFLLPYMSGGSSSDSTSIITELLGDEDPNHLYMDADQKAEMISQFTGFGFAGALAKHVQAQAQFVYNALYSLAHEDQEKINKPYSHIVDTPEASMNIFIGRNEAPYEIPSITEDDVKQELAKIFLTRKVGANLLDGLGGFTGLDELFTGSFKSLEPRPEKHTTIYKLVASDTKLKLQVFELRNGIRVNIKANTDDSASPTGYSRMQVVALGGKATQTPELKGACEFLNRANPAGFRYYYQGEEYLFENAYGSMSCENDFLSIDVQLHAACQSGSILCDVTRFNFTNYVESALLWMNPLFDNHNIEIVAEDMKRELKVAATINEPLTILTQSVIPDTIGAAFPNDTRFQPVTPEDISKLHPLAVQYWVSSQFRPDRIEINVVGDLDNSILLEDLDRWFGSLPVKPVGAKVNIGYDIYSQADKSYFETHFPTEGTKYVACDLPSIHPDRGFVASMYPAYVTDGNQYAKTMLADAILGSYFFDVIRSQYGFSYFAMTKSYHNMIMKNSSFHLVIWQTGDYPPTNSSDPMNIDRSQDVAGQAIRTPFPRRTFDDEKSSYLSQLSSELQIIDSWLPLMRGISLKVPITSSNGAKSTKSLKELNQVNLISQIQKITYDEMKDILSVPFNTYGGELRAQVRTVALIEKGDTSHHSHAQCKLY